MSDITSAAPISVYLVPGRHAHLVGIGGVSMCALGQVLHGMGMIVTGSDQQRSETTDRLERGGISVAIGHDPANIAGADLVIRTAAVHDDNPEIAAARAAGIPVFERAQSWGELMKKYPNAVCVAGTHGKTTTSSMVTHIFLEAGCDPTVMIGGYLPALGAGHRVEQFFPKYHCDPSADHACITFEVDDAFLPWNNRAVTVEFHAGGCALTQAQPHHRVRLSIATLTTLLLGYKTAAKLYRLGRMQAEEQTVRLLDDVLLHETPYISDYI